MSIENRIKGLRKAEKLSGQEFAKLLGISRGYIPLLEKGKNPPSEQLILNVCRTFRVNYDWLKHGKGEMYDKTPQFSAKGRAILNKITKKMASKERPYAVSVTAKIFGINPDSVDEPPVFDFPVLNEGIVRLVQIIEEGNQGKIDAVMAQLKALKPDTSLNYYKADKIVIRAAEGAVKYNKKKKKE